MRIMRIIKTFPSLDYVSDLSRIDSFLVSARARNIPVQKKELHINLRIVDWTIPPSIASPGICKIIGHYPDPKIARCRSGDRLSSTQFECSSVVVICPRYSNRSWGATAVRFAVPCSLLVPRRGANGAENADKWVKKRSCNASPCSGERRRGRALPTIWHCRKLINAPDTHMHARTYTRTARTIVREKRLGPTLARS